MKSIIRTALSLLATPFTRTFQVLKQQKARMLRPLAIRITLGMSLSILTSVDAVAEPLISKVEHIVVVAEDPRSLFDTFSNVFKMPVVWPFAEYGNFASGGISLGNVVLEFARIAHEGVELAPASYFGFALEPVGDTASTVQELDRLGIVHSTPDRTHQDDGWITVDLTQGNSRGANIFFCDYLNREAVASRRMQATRKLREAGGGPLGVTGAQEIVLGVPDVERAQASWRKLADDDAHSGTNGLFKFRSGPGVRLIGGYDGMRAMVVTVQSVAQTRASLARLHMLSSNPVGGVLIDPKSIGGLRILFVDAPSR